MSKPFYRGKINKYEKNVSKVDFHFFVVSYKGEWQLPGIFFGMKNIVPRRSY